MQIYSVNKLSIYTRLYSDSIPAVFSAKFEKPYCNFIILTKCTHLLDLPKAQYIKLIKKI